MGASGFVGSVANKLILPLAGWHYLSNEATFVLCVFRRVKDRHNLLHDLPLLKEPCVRQVVLDKWFPLS